MSEAKDSAPQRPARLFGRSKGHPLRGRQAELVRTLLPQLAVDANTGLDDLPQVFGRPLNSLMRSIVLEIGFGGGEHLLSEAARNQDVGFIGAEAYLNGFGKILTGIQDQGLANIRLWHGDGEDLLKRLPDASLTRVDLLYPDPWRKRRHWKRRFVRPETLDQLARIIQPGGQFRFASDWPDYQTWTLMHVRRHTAFGWMAARADDWRKPWADWPGTRYEAKAIREGRSPVYLAFERL